MFTYPNTTAYPGFSQVNGSPISAGGYSPEGGSFALPSSMGSQNINIASGINTGGNFASAFPSVYPSPYPAIPSYGFGFPQQQQPQVDNTYNILINLVQQLETQQAAPPPQPQPQQGGDMSLIMLLLMCGGLGGKDRAPSPTPAPAPTPTPAPAPTPSPRTTIDTTTTTGGTNTGTVWGDPHFTGFYGGKYDVMGQAGHTYNLISDSNVQFNAKFDKIGGDNGITYITQAGIKVGNNLSGTKNIQFNPGSTPTIDGKAINKGDTVKFDTGLTSPDGKAIMGSATFDGKKLSVNTGEYVINLTDQGNHLDQSDAITNIGVKSDGVDPSGLLGQTADGKAHNGKTGAGAQGQGAIQGAYTDYEVSSLFGDDFKYNKYGTQATQAAQQGVGAGAGATAA